MTKRTGNKVVCLTEMARSDWLAKVMYRGVLAGRLSLVLPCTPSRCLVTLVFLRLLPSVLATLNLSPRRAPRAATISLRMTKPATDLCREGGVLSTVAATLAAIVAMILI